MQSRNLHIGYFGRSFGIGLLITPLPIENMSRCASSRPITLYHTVSNTPLVTSNLSCLEKHLTSKIILFIAAWRRPHGKAIFNVSKPFLFKVFIP